ncbi:hypothetical protein LCGC14_1465810 [marine sediment metagenome]|uniref:Uncharacterized protein n=1 Tax=marine sediment metagenome TaxID=412755 RepID=A0A0F9JED3_9ZZZZ
MRTCVDCGVEYDASLFFVTMARFPCHSLKHCQNCTKKDPDIDEVIPYTEEDFKEMGIVRPSCQTPEGS